MIIENLQEMLTRKKCVYVLIFNDSAVYIGQTQHDVATRVAEHLKQDSTVRKYIKKHKINKLSIDIPFEYQREHKDLKKWLYEKESKLMLEYSKKGYELINISKMKKLGIDK